MYEERPQFTERLHMIAAGMLLAFLALVGQLANLQLGQGHAFRQQAEENAVRLIPVPAPRGIIFDREGRVVARNRPAFQVEVVPQDLPEEEETALPILERTLDLLQNPPAPPTTALDVTTPITTTVYGESLTLLYSDAQAVWQKVEEERLGAAYRPVVIARNVPRWLAFSLQEQAALLPGVRVRAVPAREYLYGPLMAHLLGYMGPIPANQREAYEARGYRPDQWVGLAGVEASYEDLLRGQDGEREIVVDVQGRVVRMLREQPPQPGYNLVLTIDMELQQKVAEILQRHLEEVGAKAGVVILEDVRTGAILSMVSLPSFDNNWFATGISAARYSELINDPWRPLVNQAISGVFPPGSTFKPFVAAAALQEGVITPYTRIVDNGPIYLPNMYFPNDPTQAQRFVCWIHQRGGKHGALNVEQALEVSCDIFFYVVGGGYQGFQGLGNDRIAYYAHQFGFGEVTGIDVPGEHSGLVPTSRWKRLNYAEIWTTGDTYNLSIGQGFLLVTPLQLVNATAAIANGGTLYRPHVVAQVVDDEGRVVQAFAPQVIRRVPVDDANLAIVRRGMYLAVYGPRGTARHVALPNVTIAGKTGTAEFAADLDGDGHIDRDEEGNLPTHAWFTAFAPYENPEVALVVFVFGGGEGSATAVPIAREVLAAYFGVPADPQQAASPEGGD